MASYEEVPSFGGIDNRTIDKNFNSYIALTLDESMTLEIRAKALVNYLSEIDNILQLTQSILDSLNDLVIYETNKALQGFIEDGTLSAIITNIITPITQQIDALVNNNATLITTLTSNMSNIPTLLASLSTRLQNQLTSSETLVTNLTNLTTNVNTTNSSYITLKETLNTALNTITTIQSRLTQSEDTYGTINSQYNTYQNTYTTLSQDPFQTNIESLRTNVTIAQNRLETILETHTNNLNSVVTLYENLNSALSNLLEFADLSRQFQQNILTLLTYLNTNQPTITTNTQTLSTIQQNINTLLSFTFNFDSQVNMINILRTLPNFTIEFITTSSGLAVTKIVYNNTANYFFIGHITNSVTFNFIDSDFLFITNQTGNLLQYQAQFQPGAPGATGQSYPLNISGNQAIINTALSNGVLQFNFSLYIPNQEVITVG